MDVDRLFRGLLLQINLLERFRHFPDSCYTLLARFLQVVMKNIRLTKVDYKKPGFLQVVIKHTFDKSRYDKKPGWLKEGIVMSTKVSSKESHPERMHLGL